MRPNWHILKEDTQYSTPIFSVLERTTENPGTGQRGQFYVLSANDWVNVVALTQNREIVLVEQYRHGIHRTSLEIPGGVIDSGENPLEAAKRELLEETGYVSDEWISLGKCSSNAAILNNFTHTFLATNCRLVSEQALDEHEDIEVTLLTESELNDAVLSERIHHAIVIAAIGRWKLWCEMQKANHPPI